MNEKKRSDYGLICGSISRIWAVSYTHLVELDGDTVDQKFMADVVSMLGLEDKLKNMPNNLSGGQQQRVAIALSLIHI